MLVLVIRDIFIPLLTKNMFCLECDFHIVIYSKDMICKRQQRYILLKKILIFLFCLLVLIRQMKGVIVYALYICQCLLYVVVCSLG